MSKLLDLRFVIGSFFSILGLLLLIYSFMANAADSQTTNRWCGISFLVFGILMIILSFQKDAHDEILPEEDKNQN